MALSGSGQKDDTQGSVTVTLEHVQENMFWSNHISIGTYFSTNLPLFECKFQLGRTSRICFHPPFIS